VGQHHRTSRQDKIIHQDITGKKTGCFIKNINGDAVVEAAILFPLMILVFAALVVLSIYLPARAALQRATQYAATAIATELSDTWLFFDDRNQMDYYRVKKKEDLRNVYVSMFAGAKNADERANNIVRYLDGRSIYSKAGTLYVKGSAKNYLIYKEVTVTATRAYTVPDGLRFLGLSGNVEITASSTAVVSDGDEFVRDIDIAVDFAEFIKERFGLDSISDAIGSFGGKLTKLFGW